MPASTQWRINIYSTTAGNGWPRVPDLKMYGTRGGANLCTGGTPIASSYNTNTAGYDPSKAFDGNVATEWQSQGTPPAWIGYQFASAVTIEAVDLTMPTTAADVPVAMDLQYYNTATSAWVTYFTLNAAAGHRNGFLPGTVMPFDRVHGRRVWGVLMTAAQSSSSWITLRQLDLYAPGSSVSLCTGGGGFSMTDSDLPISAIDNNASTIWQSRRTISAGNPTRIGYFCGVDVPDIGSIKFSTHTTPGDGPIAGKLQYLDYDTGPWNDYATWTTPATWVSGEVRTIAITPNILRRKRRACSVIC